MKILVCGGRDYSDKKKVFDTLDQVQPSSVVHGAATGADTLAAKWCSEEGVKQFPFPANWEKFGKRAGPMRNTNMLDMHPDIKLVLAFPGGRGTENMILQAQSRKIKVIRVKDEKAK